MHGTLPLVTLNCSTKSTFNPRQIMEFNSIQSLDNNQFENDYPSDFLDAMADLAYEQEEAIRESQQDDWVGIVPAHDHHYSFLYSYPICD